MGWCKLNLIVNSSRINDPVGTNLVFVVTSQSSGINNNKYSHHHICIYAYLCMFIYIDADRIVPIDTIKKSTSVVVIIY